MYLFSVLLCVVSCCYTLGASSSTWISSTTTTSLDGAWSLRSTDGTYSNLVSIIPGDIISDLERAGKIPDPIFENTWLTSSPIWQTRDWVVSKSIAVPADVLAVLAAGGDVLLVFEGIKMGATVSVNGAKVLTATDQFLRYTTSIAAAALASAKGDTTTATTVNVAITFAKAGTVIDTDARFMACTGGWDWAPYSNATVKGVGSGMEARALSFGVVGSVYTVLVAPGNAAMHYVVPTAVYAGEYTVTKMVTGDFSVRVAVVLSNPAAAAATGVLSISSKFGNASKSISIPPRTDFHEETFAMTAKSVDLWWPNGLGDHVVYEVRATFTPPSGTAASMSRPLGFRNVAVVTIDDTDPSAVAKARGQFGTGTHGMYFRINGVAVWARGANMIPLDQFEGRLTAAQDKYGYDGESAVQQYVRSSALAGMNILRVWGGGVYQPEAFYDSCDTHGIMVYHDMMYAQEGHWPAETSTQAAELQHQVRRLAAHPSIVLWDGCNECRVSLNSPTGIFVTFVVKNIIAVDQSRAVWPSCPSHGWDDGVDRLYARPAAGRRMLPSTGSGTFEEHGPYLHGAAMPAFPTVNPSIQVPDVKWPTTVSTIPLGVSQSNVFTSEFGSVGMSSFESMSATLETSHWSLHGGLPPAHCRGTVCDLPNPMAQRNYACDSIIIGYFGNGKSANWRYDLADVGEEAFKQNLYLCMAGQAVHLKGEISDKRSQPSFGTMVWQLGENWPTGGWGSLEYASPNRTGQVTGGRWKPLHHVYKRDVFQDLFVSCSFSTKGYNCILKWDGSFPCTGTVLLQQLNLADSSTNSIVSHAFNIPVGPGSTFYFNGTTVVDASNSIVQALVKSSAGPYRNEFILAGAPAQFVPAVKAGGAHIEIVGIDTHSEPTPHAVVHLKNSGRGAGAFVTLTTGEAGFFDDNFFFLSGGATRDLTFYPYFLSWDAANFRTSTRVESMNSYL